MSAALYERLESLFRRHGEEAYGEAVTQSEHALQCAALAEAEGAPRSLVVAALLHDIGHLLEVSDDAFGLHKHDRVGGSFLAQHFGPAVSEPVRLHVAAKRYLCSKEPDYMGRLSEASTYSLGKQGGPMTAAEMAVFETETFFEEALRLRRWDEGGKQDGLTIPPLAHYRHDIETLSSS